MLLALTELAEQVFGLNLQIDTALALPFVGADSLHPGRMSTNTMVCFILMAAAQFLMLKGMRGWSESVGMSVRSWAGFLLMVIARIAALWKRDIADQPRLHDWFLPFLGVAVGSISTGMILVFTGPEAKPFSLDPRYAAGAQRISIDVCLSMATLAELTNPKPT